MTVNGKGIHKYKFTALSVDHWFSEIQAIKVLIN